MVVTISHEGYIKRTPLATYRAQRRGGKGNRGMDAREDDFVNQLFICSTHSFVFFFGTTGKVYVKKVYEIPQAARNAKGRAVVNFIGMEEGERVAAITPVATIEIDTMTAAAIATRREMLLMFCPPRLGRFPGTGTEVRLLRVSSGTCPDPRTSNTSAGRGLTPAPERAYCPPQRFAIAYREDR